MKYEREPLSINDMRKGRWNRKKALRVVAPRAERFFDCGPMTEWEARWTIVGLVVLGALFIAALLTLDQPPM